MTTRIDRREFVKRAAYAAPVILTLKAMPAFAATGSNKYKATSKGEPPAQSGLEGSRRGSTESTRNRR
jgi:hypothetical protein